MSDHLDDFLRQAAERRAKRQQQPKSEPAKPRQVFNSPNAPTQTASKPAREPPKPPAPRLSDMRPSVGNLEPSLSSRHVESDLQYADERMESHLKEAFTSEIRSPEGIRMLRPSEAAPGSTSIRTNAVMITSGDIKVQLRDPQTLRLAIIAQEVLKRPYS